MNAKKTLDETVDLMLSENEDDQFKAEYYQLENRIIDLNQKLLEADLDPENSSQLQRSNERMLLGEKMTHMRNLLYVLQREAKQREITL